MSDSLEKKLEDLANQISSEIRDMKQGNFVTNTEVMVESLAYYRHKIQVCQNLAAKQVEQTVEKNLHFAIQQSLAELEQKNRELTAELNIWKQSAPKVTINDGIPTTYFTIPTTPCTITIKQ